MDPGASSPSPTLRLFGPGFYENPYPTYHALRAAAPVFWDADIDAWVLTRYADVAAALADPRLRRGSTPEQEAAFAAELSARGQDELAPLHQLLAQMMLFSDPPKHTRLRALTHKAFTPRVVDALRPHIQAVVEDALDAVEEMLRYDASVQLRGLGVAEDFALGGQQIRAGQAVMLALGGANRDPAQFVDPDRFDIARPERLHLALGRGIHFCIGAALARAEIQIAISSMLRRLPALRLATQALEWRTGSIFRGVTALPVAFTS